MVVGRLDAGGHGVGGRGTVDQQTASTDSVGRAATSRVYSTIDQRGW